MGDHNDYSEYSFFIYPRTLIVDWYKRKMPRRTQIITFGWLKKNDKRKKRGKS